MRRAAAVVLVLLPAAVHADEVYLKGGGRLSGVVLERTPTSLTVRVGPGRLTLPIARVERIVSGRSPLEEYEERAQRIARDDADGWLGLALWAREQDLLTQAREAFERVTALSPRNATAQRALGNVRLDDRWVTPEESYRARGYVQFEGAWITPDERTAIVEERAASARAAAERARAAEAEARAREAEARALAAETETRTAFGIPYGPYVFPGTLGAALVSSCRPFPRSPLVPGQLNVPMRARRSSPITPSVRPRHPSPSRDGSSGGRRSRTERP